MKQAFFILILVALAGVGLAADQVWQVRTHASTSTVAVTANAPAFVGALDEVAVYVPADGTGTVTFAAVDPYSGASLTLGTVSAATAYTVFRPRVAAVAEGGANALVITNSGASTERFLVAGESIRATLSDANGTNKVWTFRLKYER